MEEQVFADGIGSIAVIGGAVRLDFFTFSSAEKDANGQPKPIPGHRLVMTVPAFLLAARKIQDAVDAIGKANNAAAPRSVAESVTTQSTPAKAPFP